MQKIKGFDDCIIGICHRCGEHDIIAYDMQKVLDKLEKDFTPEKNVTKHDVAEYFYYNIVGAYDGETTPCFIDYDDLRLIDLKTS